MLSCLIPACSRPSRAGSPLSLLAPPRVSHLSLASPPLTGGTCPLVPLRISRLLFKSISMLNSRRRGSGVGDAAVAGPPGGWRGERSSVDGRERLRHHNEEQVFRTFRSCRLIRTTVAALSLFASSPSNLLFIFSCGLALHHSAFSPLAFLILLPSPSSSLFLSLSHSIADFHSQERVLISDGSRKRVVTRCWAWVPFSLCVCVGSPSHATPGGPLCIAPPSLYNNDMSAFQSSPDNMWTRRLTGTQIFQMDHSWNTFCENVCRQIVLFRKKNHWTGREARFFSSNSLVRHVRRGEERSSISMYGL